MAAAPALALAQAHQVRSGGYVLRSNVVDSQAIPRSVARAHGIHAQPGRALLDVVVLKTEGAARHPVEAEVKATAVNLAGMEHTIDMQPAAAPNGDVSYVGTFDYASREVVTVHVHATPRVEGAPGLELQFRQRMPRR